MNASTMGTEDLYAEHKGYVIEVAMRYRNYGVPLEDLINEGAIGLIEAARRFDSGRGNRFLTYATFWIQKRILGALDRQTRIVHLPDYRAKKLRRMLAAQHALSQQLGRAASDEEVQAATGSRSNHAEHLNYYRTVEISIDGAPDGVEKRLRDLVDSDTGTPEEKMLSDENFYLIHEALGILDTRQRAVIIARYGLVSGRIRTLQDLATEMGLSREGARKIEITARSRIARYLAQRFSCTPRTEAPRQARA